MSTVDIFQNEQKECGSEMYFSKMNPVDPFILRPGRGEMVNREWELNWTD